MSATAATKIQPQHRRRQALVYVRQSTTKQLGNYLAYVASGILWA